VIAAAVLAVGLLLAQGGGERVATYDAVLEVESSGDLLVRETITYDFGPNERRGILRDIPVRARYDDKHDRRYPLRVLSVSSATAPDQHTTEQVGADLRIRIGHPDRYIRGVHTYELVYRVEGALNGFEDHVELYWNVTGSGWQVPIDEVRVRVLLPGSVQGALCFAGPTGSSLPCDTAGTSGGSAVFSHRGLGSYEGVTVVVGMPLGVVPDPRPVLEERWSLDRAFSRTPSTVGMATFAGLGALFLVGSQAWRSGRDRRAVGSAIDVAFAEHGAADEPVPLLARHEIPVEFAPPDRLLPGQLGLLVDERAHVHDVTATIVDLATKGWLRIEQVGESGWFRKPDWRLVRLRDGTEGLVTYEALLLEGLFEDADAEGAVLLSDLKEKFAERLGKVRDAMYDDAVARHWFRGRPDKVRSAWAAGGIFLVVATIGLTVLAAARTRWGLVPLALLPAALFAVAAAPRMAARTAAGTAVLRRALGFKRFIDESERNRAQFAEQKQLFTEYLPYAVAFGATERWARAFAGLADPPPAPSWYVGTPGSTFDVRGFGSSIQGFTTATTGTIASTPASSGSSGFGGGGFSGGGGGGGGGGSW
jgi:uncharacterized membrane protein YgcG